MERVQLVAKKFPPGESYRDELEEIHQSVSSSVLAALKSVLLNLSWFPRRELDVHGCSILHIHQSPYVLKSCATVEVPPWTCQNTSPRKSDATCKEVTHERCVRIES
jgi:hypothetical protein